MKNIILIFIAFGVLSACSNKQNPNIKIFEKLYGTTLLLPQNLQNINDTIKNSDEIFNKPVKIVSNVFFGCGDCIADLDALDDFVSSFNSSEISLIVYGTGDKSNSGIYTFLTIKPDFKYPIFSDTANLFIKTNKLPEDNLAFHTFLVDKKDSIRVIGSPIGNKKIAELYNQEIKKILEED